MFEKEAEDSFKCKKVLYKWETDKHSYIDGFKDGAEFGYNKCKEELNQKGLALQFDMDKTIEQNIALKKELNKANEWHYMKDVNCDEDFHFPSEEEKKGRVLIWKVKVITESGTIQPVCYHCGSYDDLWYEINIYYVIAWKEITLPEEE